MDWEGQSFGPCRWARSTCRPAASRKPLSRSTPAAAAAYRLGFELTAEGQTWRQGAEFKYAVIVPLKGVGNAEDSFFAMNTHMERSPRPTWPTAWRSFRSAA